MNKNQGHMTENLRWQVLSVAILDLQHRALFTCFAVNFQFERFLSLLNLTVFQILVWSGQYFILVCCILLHSHLKYWNKHGGSSGAELGSIMYYLFCTICFHFSVQGYMDKKAAQQAVFSLQTSDFKFSCGFCWLYCSLLIAS